MLAALKDRMTDFGCLCVKRCRPAQKYSVMAAVCLIIYLFFRAIFFRALFFRAISFAPYSSVPLQPRQMRRNLLAPVTILDDRFRGSVRLDQMWRLPGTCQPQSPDGWRVSGANRNNTDAVCLIDTCCTLVAHLLHHGRASAQRGVLH